MKVLILFIATVALCSANNPQWQKINYSLFQLNPSHVPSTRSANSAVVLKGRYISLFGGHSDEREETYNDLHVFDTKWNNFTRLSPTGMIPSNRTWYAANAISSDEEMIFGGGKFDGFNIIETHNDVFVYSRSQNKWIKKNTSGDVPPPVITPSAVRQDNRMYIFGGELVSKTFAPLTIF